MDSKFENVLGKILGSDKDCEKAVKYWKSLVEYGSLEYLEEVLAYATRSFVELGRELEESDWMVSGLGGEKGWLFCVAICHSEPFFIFTNF